ncbi:MAG TPA: hypothetical protein VGP84_05765, partial [Gemmatimonadaceae bacterium]|nr:hypothetical protein [Gemmatimonadaceae bacterium]
RRPSSLGSPAAPPGHCARRAGDRQDRRATAEVRHGLERSRSLLRRTDLRVVSTPDGRYRLTMRLDRPLAADRRA